MLENIAKPGVILKNGVEFRFVTVMVYNKKMCILTSILQEAYHAFKQNSIRNEMAYAALASTSHNALACSWGALD